MLLVALTGGIGSGKSTAVAFFGQCGAEVIEADKLAREVLEVGTPGLDAVKAHFGTKILHRDKSLNREALGKIIFADLGQRTLLEEIVHPLVHRLFEQRVVSLAPDAVVIYEIPLLAEVGRADDFQLVITLETPLSMRIERLAKRGLSQDDVMNRISEQASNAERRAIADIVLTNSTTELNFINALSTIWNLRLKPFAENLAQNRPAKIEESVGVSLPNLLPPSNQIGRIATRIENALNGKVEIVSPTELNISTDEVDFGSKMRHLGFAEIDPDLHFASADPGRPLNVWVATK